MAWTTRLHGVDFHIAWFVPHGWPGKGVVVAIGIPECETTFSVPGTDGVPLTLVNRPTMNMDIIHWLRMACSEATKQKAALFLNCDTLEQLDRWVGVTVDLLPGHKRMPLERFYRAEDRADKTH